MGVRKEKQDVNRELISAIQPAGGVKFEESFIKKGDGYEACLHVYKFPKLVDDFWLASLFNMENCITTLDFVRDDTHEVRKAMNKSMAEHNARYMQETDNLGKMDARDSYEELAQVHSAMKDGGDVMKSILLRLFVHGATLDELEKNVSATMKELENRDFRAAVLLNEQEYEWKSLFQGYSTQMKEANKRRGKQLPSSALAGSYPFYFTNLHDPRGSYYGQTNTGGYVILDVFHKDAQRLSYNGIVMGSMGSGKSTLLKKIGSDRAIRGDIVRGFDVTGEFRALAEAHGGKTISLDGSDGIINPLHVFRTAEDEQTSFTMHLSKIANFYRFIAPEADDGEVKEFENLVHSLYVEKGMWEEELTQNKKQITNLANDAYPVFTDLLVLIREELYSNLEKKIQHDNLSQQRRNRLENMELTIHTLVRSYGKLFDGHTSIENFQEEQVIYFEIKQLAGMKSEIFQAQMFNVTNLLWDELLQKGLPQKEAFDRGELSLDDVMYYFIEMDEAHQIVNTNPESQEALKMLINFARQARKYFGGILFASHTIRDFVPEGSDADAVTRIKTLFNLSSYKFIMKQDRENLEQIQNVFSGALSQSEVGDIPMLPTGDTILTIAGAGNIRFSIECSPEELALYGGGL